LLTGKRIGLGITASHCTYEDVVPKIQNFIDVGATVIPIITHSVLDAAKRFGTGEEWIAKIEALNAKNIYFIPFGQDAPHSKPNSLIADFEQMVDTVHAAITQKKQLQPLLIQYFK